MSTDMRALLLDQVEEQIKDLMSRLESLRLQFEALGRQMNEISEQIEQLQEERDALKVAQMRDGMLDWAWLLEYMPETAAREEGCRQALDRYGLGLARYNPSTNQVVPQIRLIQGNPSSLTRHLEGLEVLLPYLKPAEDGTITLAILGDRAAVLGDWALKINPQEKSYRVYAHPLYRQGDQYFSLLEDALTYIQQHLYWRKAD